MNKQKTATGRGIEWTDYTWNPVAGCKHACEWKMPNGQRANCYAEDVADRVAKAAYPNGFEHHYWRPEVLDAPLKVKDAAKVFIGSMADVFGWWVPDDQIELILETCRKAPQHTFQFLTKNAPRLKDFTFPDNVWVGVSSPPDWMFGHEMTQRQKENMLRVALKTLKQVRARVRWMSFEPLSWNVAPIVAEHAGALQWAVIGAASNGRKEYAPSDANVQQLLGVLDAQGAQVFFKGNMRASKWAQDNWRDGFPAEQRKMITEVMNLPTIKADQVDEADPLAAFREAAQPLVDFFVDAARGKADEDIIAVRKPDSRHQYTITAGDIRRLAKLVEVQ